MMKTVKLGYYRANQRATFEQAVILTEAPVRIVDSDRSGWINLLVPTKCGDLSVFWLVAKTLLAQRQELLALLAHQETEWQREAVEADSDVWAFTFWTAAKKARTVRLCLGGV